jgi:D-tyrosyl-tRNA(Tyr) deacylase
MRAVVQRVSQASVEVEGAALGGIQRGLLVLVGVEEGDGWKDVDFICRKLVALRIFEDSQGKMNLSVSDVAGKVLLVSQFTLFGDCRKGSRPSFTRAAPPEQAEELYLKLAGRIRREGILVETGRFRARMRVASVNEGPVTLIIDSKKEFY